MLLFIRWDKHRIVLQVACGWVGAGWTYPRPLAFHCNPLPSLSSYRTIQSPWAIVMYTGLRGISHSIEMLLLKTRLQCKISLFHHERGPEGAVCIGGRAGNYDSVCLKNTSTIPLHQITQPLHPKTYFSVAAKDQILEWTLTGGRTSSIIHQMKAKNLRIQKLPDAGTKKLYKWRYHTVTMATFLK